MKSIDLVVMDWGIGGLSVYNEIQRQIPGLSILYFSDSGQMPYGKMPVKKLRARLLELITNFSRQDITHFVIACNAASTALPSLEKEFKKRNLNVIGVIDRGVELVMSTPHKRVGVIGGKRTILSRCYTKKLTSKNRKVMGRVAQPLSALIESGELESPLMTQTLTKILKPLKNCDALLLACTHYPAVSNQIQGLLPKSKLLDPAKTTASYIQKKWKFKKSKAGQTTSFVTSGNVKTMKKAAKAAFGINISGVVKTNP